MTDLWILAFVFRGVIAAAGDTMPLEECEERALAAPASITGAVCINVRDPACRIHINDHIYTRDSTHWCRKRATGARK